MVGLVLCLLLSYGLVLADPQSGTRDIAAIVESSGFSTLIRLLMQAGVKQSLMRGGSFTLFAPTNAAFKALNDSTVRGMLLDPQQLENILLYHIVSGRITSDMITDGVSVMSLDGRYLKFSVDIPHLRVNDVDIVEFDIPASNGVIHVVDEVLVPPKNLSLLMKHQGPPIENNILEVASRAGIRTMNEILSDAGLTGMLSSAGPYTMFAPSDKAFSEMNPELVETLMEDGDLLRNVLLYHVIPGRYPSFNLTNDFLVDSVQGESLRSSIFKKPKQKRLSMINGANFARTDLKASNGILHIIDKVLDPPGGNIIDILERNPRFSLLLDTVNEAGLSQFLKTDSSFTLFAPNNKAFQNVDRRLLKRAMKQKGILSEIVLRHLVLGINHGPLFSSVLCWDSILTANNIMLKTGIGVNGTRTIASPYGAGYFLKSDMLASNGVIHEINAIL